MEEVKTQTENKAQSKTLSNFISVLTKKKGVRKYPRNRQGMRMASHDSGTLAGHSRKSPARYKVHTPTAQELIEWSEWKAEQKAKKYQEA